jgi:hypothetical protein
LIVGEVAVLANTLAWSEHPPLNAEALGMPVLSGYECKRGNSTRNA